MERRQEPRRGAGGGTRASPGRECIPRNLFLFFIFLLLIQREHFVVDYQQVSTIYGSIYVPFLFPKVR